MTITPYEEFPSLNAFKEALESWAIEDHFETRYKHSNFERVAACCRCQAECPFGIRAYFDKKRGCAVVLGLNVLHNCLGAAPIARAPASRLSWLPDKLPE
jgi:hypothetical protein